MATEQSQTTDMDAQLDRQYRLGYEQAWREWSSCASPLLFRPFQKISNEDISILEKRRARVAQRGGPQDV